jgi:predicted signal transduction protein with EAL and GGDEF domain
MTTKRRSATIKKLEAELARLRAENARLARSLSFGCLNRNALQELLPDVDCVTMCAVYWDLDRFKNHNTIKGKKATNREITEILGAFRDSDIIIGQWFSGDEFVAIVPIVDAMGFAQRIVQAFKRYDYEMTVVIFMLDADQNIFDQIDQAEALVSIAKARNLRSNIHYAEDLQ